MSINPYSLIQNVYNAKLAYGNATTDEERKKQQDIANQARQKLVDYGYKDVADSISAAGADVNATKQIMDKWAKFGKTPTRDYFYSLGKGKDLSTGEIDSKIGWDNDTKELSYGGVKIGTPDAIVDGVSYWSDENLGKLQKAFEDDIARTGTTRNTETALKQENENLFSKYNQAYDDLTKTNPFTTDEAKAIMGKYDLAGLQARDNAVASGGASNGGNIDSYAAANAMRQQSTLINQGQNAVLDAHQQKIDNVRGILSDMGVNIDRVFNQDQTAKNNEVARLSEQASVTGTVPTEWSYKDNIYLNSDGTVRDEYLTDEFDATGGFTTIINNAKSKLATATNPTEIANLNATIKYANQAKALKTFSSPKYEKYAHEVEAVAPDVTSNHYLEEKAIDAGLEATKNTNETNMGLGQLEANTTMYSADKATEASKYEVDAAKEANQSSQEYIQKALDHYNAAQNLFDPENTGPREFIKKYLAPDEKGNVKCSAEDLITLLTTESAKYNIDVEDAREICSHYNVYTSWLDGYRDRTDEDGGVEVDGKTIKGQYGGMVKK